MMKHLHPSPSRCLLPCIGAGLILAGSAAAGSRRFAYSYETTTMAKGAMEYENITTWKTDKKSDPDFERFDIRNEFEYGMTDRLQLAFYFADLRYQQESGKSDDFTFHDVAFEAIYNLTDPNTTAFGSALYGEVKGSDDFIELEAKLLLQKNIGQWIFVCNLGAAIEWEDDYTEDKAELMQSLGVSYQFNPSWSAGVEMLNEIEVPDVESIGDSAFYMGPNVSWRNERFALTAAGLWQLTSLDGEPGFQLRTVFSVDF